MAKHFKVEAPEGVEVLGKCPNCGNPVIEGERGFGCVNWKMDVNIPYGKMISI